MLLEPEVMFSSVLKLDYWKTFFNHFATSIITALSRGGAARNTHTPTPRCRSLTAVWPRSGSVHLPCPRAHFHAFMNDIHGYAHHIRIFDLKKIEWRSMKIQRMTWMNKTVAWPKKKIAYSQIIKYHSNNMFEKTNSERNSEVTILHRAHKCRSICFLVMRDIKLTVF